MGGKAPPQEGDLLGRTIRAVVGHDSRAFRDGLARAVGGASLGFATVSVTEGDSDEQHSRLTGFEFKTAPGGDPGRCQT